MSGETEQAVSGWTTDTLHSQIMMLLDERAKRFEAESAALKTTIETRINAMDRAITLLHDNVSRSPTEVDKQIAHLHDVVFATFKTGEERFKTVDERFRSVDTQFSGRDTAVAAALQAQKEAAGEQNKSFTVSIDKSEKGTLEQISQQRVLLQTTQQGLDGKIDDLKDRLTRLESMGIGRVAATTEHQTSSRDLWGQWGLGLGALVGVAGIALALLK